MYIATLIAPKGVLDPALAENLRNAWGGEDVVWLSPDEAADFALAELPDNQWEVWADLQGLQVDLIIQRAEGRRKKMLLADMDSTMIQQECIDELADETGVGDHVKEITALAMDGKIDFEGALVERVKLMKGSPESVVTKVLEERITYVPGGAVLLATMKANGAYAALVSGGFTSFTTRVAGELGFDEHRANSLIVENGVLTGEVGFPILGRQAKIEALDEITGRLGLGAQDVIAVGDGANDLGMLGHAGTGVALHAKPSVAAECDVRINHGDLTALLFLQGYAISEFVPGRAA